MKCFEGVGTIYDDQPTAAYRMHALRAWLATDALALLPLLVRYVPYDLVRVESERGARMRMIELDETPPTMG